MADKRLFCGTALVEFSEEGEAKTTLEKTLAYAGADLELKTKYALKYSIKDALHVFHLF